MIEVRSPWGTPPVALPIPGIKYPPLFTTGAVIVPMPLTIPASIVKAFALTPPPLSVVMALACD